MQCIMHSWHLYTTFFYRDRAVRVTFTQGVWGTAFFCLLTLPESGSGLYTSVFKYRRRRPCLHVALIQPGGALRVAYARLRLHRGDPDEGWDTRVGGAWWGRGASGGARGRGRGGALSLSLSARAHLHTLQQLGSSASLAELVQLRLLADLLHSAPVDEHLE